jgi:hypothetical protein
MWHAWERTENYTRFWWESQKERDHSEDKGVDEMKGLGWILGRFSGGVWIGFDWLMIGTVESCCECGDETSRSCVTELVS